MVHKRGHEYTVQVTIGPDEVDGGLHGDTGEYSQRDQCFHCPSR